MHPIAILRLALILVGGPASRPITPCDFGGAYLDRQDVEVRSVAQISFHGVFLVGLGCSGETQHAVLLARPGDPTIPAVDFKLPAEAESSLLGFGKPFGEPSFVCGLFVGRIFVKKDFRSRRLDGVFKGNGYGENGALRSVFVLKGVSDLRSCPGDRNP